MPKNDAFCWTFTDDLDGTFKSESFLNNSRLFFPLFNRIGMKCSITPDMKGDMCSSFHSYHSIPVVTEDFHRIVNGQYVWIRPQDGEPWCAAGTSAKDKTQRWLPETEYTSRIKGSTGAFEVEKYSKKLNLKSTSRLFVPNNEDLVLISIIEIENTGDSAKVFELFYATPIYGRSADNLRDHRNVTSMFNRIYLIKNGVRVQPMINFNEFGHTDNSTSYYTLGFTGEGQAPEHIWGTMVDFIGEGGSMDHPKAVYKNVAPPPLEDVYRNGQEAVGALKFRNTSILPGEKQSFIVINGIAEEKNVVSLWKNRYGDTKKASGQLSQTRNAWKELTKKVTYSTGSRQFDQWTIWLNYQLFCRQVYGNSYLPDFGYGRGGRGWRDLWSDLLSLFLMDPDVSVEEMINNFRGIRTDGTNATIIGARPGEFIADRNNVPRTWCDHGVWPVFVLDFYIHQTGDINILMKKVPYWKDVFVYRSKKRDEKWNPEYGYEHKDQGGKVYEGTILEHVLLQQLCSFFNVGDHNIMLLEGGDWNDTYDMARNNGESVCFYNWVAGNLKTLVSILSELKSRGIEEVTLFSEMSFLFDTIYHSEEIDYKSVTYKKRVLNEFCHQVEHTLSGKQINIEINLLINDLELKSRHILEQIRKHEWLSTSEGYSFFNGHYDDERKRVHGDHPKGVRIDLTSQVLPVIFGTANDEQIPELHKSVLKYLHHQGGGLHLCSDFNEDRLYFGRVTGFAFGHKEHGGIWMQQNVMYMYGLYKRGFVNEGFDVFKDIFHLCNTPEISKVFPGIPSYFGPDGRGYYMYLTGSATWLVLALLTQMFGIRGENGQLRLNPKLKRDQFDQNSTLKVYSSFRGYETVVTYSNPNKKDYGEYLIRNIIINQNTTQKFNIAENTALLDFEELEKVLDKSELNCIEVLLD